MVCGKRAGGSTVHNPPTTVRASASSHSEGREGKTEVVCRNAGGTVIPRQNRLLCFMEHYRSVFMHSESGFTFGAWISSYPMTSMALAVLR